LKVTFYGASGSIPTPSNRTFSRTEFGGNTTCIFLEVGDRFIVIDMGSGARALGNMLAKRMPFDAHVFFTHLHWDHIQGMPFFTPLYVPGNKLHFHAPEKTKTDPIASVEEVLSNQMQYPTFPRQLRQCPAFVDFTIFKWFDPAFVLYEKAGDKTSKPIVRVTHFELNHPDECVGYVVEECATGKKFACVTDTEQYSVLNTNIQKACKGVDLYYADAQYTEDEYSVEDRMGTFDSRGVHQGSRRLWSGAYTDWAS
jgi:phosphoribosyl 1,2-cyclic phosphodiesterase